MARIQQSSGEKIADVLIYFCLWIVIFITSYPFIYVISMSISEPINVINRSVWLLPKGFSFDAYAKVFENPDILRSYYNTVFYTVFGTAISVVITMLAAYPLSRKSFFARKQIMIILVITMFFSGGLIPTFLLIQNLGIYNTRWAILLPAAASAFLIIVARTFLQSIPESLHESAKLDGANDLTILFRIIVPLSKPIIAVLTLFYAVTQWNSYLPALLYLPDSKLQPLSLYLIKIIIDNSTEMLQQGMSDQFGRTMSNVQLKYAMIIVAVLPILCVYPFLQKYFLKGVMIGSLKE